MRGDGRGRALGLAGTNAEDFEKRASRSYSWPSLQLVVVLDLSVAGLGWGGNDQRQILWVWRDYEGLEGALES